ncbi:hypothetical protein [Rhizobium sp. Root1204]|uniref:hypothetical protein n=1 Tax=Rhizobium sp. Root1204 TaxID=1736428 RepID=UPI000713B3CD|nr:hypothetical protein [Rhizobium sp. Root1204]KQV31820.1 cupin [Rhizobium sp. Root1204]
MEFEKIIFPASGWVPNNPRLPVLIYKNALPNKPSSDGFEELFEIKQWTGIWRNGVFDYQHYHSDAHEVLGVGQGNATLLIGGPDGRAIEVVPGNCLILPAGTGHMNLGSSPDFEVVGAYPVGQRADIQIAPPSPEMLSRISGLRLPDTDPVQGPSGPLIKAWRS